MITPHLNIQAHTTLCPGTFTRPPRDRILTFEANYFAQASRRSALCTACASDIDDRRCTHLLVDPVNYFKLSLTSSGLLFGNGFISSSSENTILNGRKETSTHWTVHRRIRSKMHTNGVWCYVYIRRAYWNCNYSLAWPAVMSSRGFSMATHTIHSGVSSYWRR